MELLYFEMQQNILKACFGGFVYLFEHGEQGIGIKTYRC